MKSRSSLIFLGVVILAVVLGFALHHRGNLTASASHPADAASAEHLKSSASSKWIEQIKDSPGLPEAKLTEEEKNSECRQTLEAIETVPFKALVADLGQGQLKLNSKCLFRSSNDIKSLQGFPEICEKLENGQPSIECMQKLLFYKALRIHHATIDENLDSLSTEILIQKVFGLIADAAFNTPDGLKMIRAVGAKLYERLPDSESAAKAAVLGFIADDRLEPQEQAKFEELITETRAKFPENWELYEIDLVVKKRKGDDSFKEQVLNFYKSHPDMAIAAYYMGCLKWSEGQQAEAKNLFQLATTRAPQDARFANTWQQATMANPPAQVCSVQIGFNPEQF